jgi:tripartite-type tricarboxylate transporter receptor subunit TctC
MKPVFTASTAASAGTPREIVGKLSASANDALKSPEVAKAFALQGIDALGGTPADFAKFIREDSDRWNGVLALIASQKK